MSSYNPLMSNCNHFVNDYVYIHTIHTMSIDMVIENSELMLLHIASDISDETRTPKKR